MKKSLESIAVIGQGYVGLPLAIAFSSQYSVIGFDINSERVSQLQNGVDLTREVDSKDLFKAFDNGFKLTTDSNALKESTIFIITVPTPIDEFNAPDLRFLLKATKDVARVMQKDSIVIFESTVFPGCTEEECVPVLEKYSGLVYNKDFFVGYSPERINPGDKVHKLDKVVKITSGSTPEAAHKIDYLYNQIIHVGTHLAPSIKVAEAAKAIENAQRDVNISFVNELALIFDRIGIDTQDVLDAAATKYNFLRFKPGLVGGHCISVDPYYLAHKSSQLGYHPEVILSGRRVNDRMAEFVVSKVVKLMLKKNISVRGSRILILGMTFKENCPDVRNSKVVDIYKELIEYGAAPEIFDPWVNQEEVKIKYPNIDVVEALESKYDAIILAVAHNEFSSLNISDYKRDSSVVFDCKSFLDKKVIDGRL